MQCDVIIVGQGLAGTILGHKLESMGKKVLFFDPGHIHSSSKVAAGIINPVTGRNYVKSWIIDDILPVALKTYKQLEYDLDIRICNKLPIIRGLNFAEQENLWFSKAQDPDYSMYISTDVDRANVDEYIHPVFSYGLVHNAYQIDLPLLLNTYRKRLLSRDMLREDYFDYSKLKIEEGKVVYDSIRAAQIVFAEGWQGKTNPFFSEENFNLVKGEMLLVRIPNGPKFNLRHNIFITPLGGDIYWCGSNYDRNFKDIEPSEVRRKRMEAFLEDIIKVPYEIVDHKAGIRPATIDRKPIVKQHPEIAQMYIFNGMGAKGSSMIPYFAEEMCDDLIHNGDISPI